MVTVVVVVVVVMMVPLIMMVMLVTGNVGNVGNFGDWTWHGAKPSCRCLFLDRWLNHRVPLVSCPSLKWRAMELMISTGLKKIKIVLP